MTTMITQSVPSVLQLIKQQLYSTSITTVYNRMCYEVYEKISHWRLEKHVVRVSFHFFCFKNVTALSVRFSSEGTEPYGLKPIRILCVISLPRFIPTGLNVNLPDSISRITPVQTFFVHTSLVNDLRVILLSRLLVHRICRACKQIGCRPVRRSKRKEVKSEVLADRTHERTTGTSTQSGSRSQEVNNTYVLPAWCATVPSGADRIKDDGPKTSLHSTSGKVSATSGNNGFSFLPDSIQRDSYHPSNYSCSSQQHSSRNFPGARLGSSQSCSNEVPQITVSPKPTVINSISERDSVDSCLPFTSPDLPYLHKLAQNRSPSPEELSKGLSELKALQQRRTAETDLSMSSRLAIQELITQIESSLLDSDCSNSVRFTADSRARLKQLLGTITTNQISTVYGDKQKVNDENGEEEKHSDGPRQTHTDKANQMVLSAVDAILSAVGNACLTRPEYIALRQHLLKLLETNQSANAKTALQDLDAPDSLPRDLSDFVSEMDQQFGTSKQVHLDGRTRDNLGDLVYRLNMLVSTCNSQPLTLGLQTLYEVSVNPDTYQSNQIVLSRSEATLILRGLELANREHSRSVRNDRVGYNSPKNLWSVSEQLTRQLDNELTQKRREYCAINLKEAMVVQQVLLAVLSVGNASRNPREKAVDAKYFAFYSGQLRSTTDSTDDERSNEMLSPIAEMCSPETSVYEAHTSQSERDPPMGLGSRDTVSSEKESVNEHAVKRSQNNSAGVISTDKHRAGWVSNKVRDGCCNVNGHRRLPRTCRQEESDKVKVEKSVAQRLTRYLQVKMLEFMPKTNRRADGDQRDQIKKLTDKINSAIRKTTEEHVELTKLEVECAIQVLENDNTAYANTLKSVFKNYMREQRTPAIQEIHAIKPDDENGDYITKRSFHMSPQQSEQLNSLLQTVQKRVASELTPEQANEIVTSVLKLESTIPHSALVPAVRTARAMQCNPHYATQLPILASQLQKLCSATTAVHTQAVQSSETHLAESTDPSLTISVQQSEQLNSLLQTVQKR
ncbi:hypothetical protein CLF_110197, partial [Clonorchis sinensis]